MEDEIIKAVMDSTGYYPGKENLEDWPDEHPVQELSAEIERSKADRKSDLLEFGKEIRAWRERAEKAEEYLKLMASSYDANAKGWKADRDAAINLLRQWIKASDSGDDHNVYQVTKELLTKYGNF